MTIQNTVTNMPARASLGERSAMKRTMMCGWPKYPNPHARLPMIAAAEIPLNREK